MAARQLMSAEQIAADRDKWLEFRSIGIGASEVAAMLGICPPSHGSPFALFVAKKFGEDMAGDTDAMARGRHLESYVADRFARNRDELAVMDGGLYANGSRAWQMATFDRLAVDMNLTEHGPGQVIDGVVQVPHEVVYPVQIKTSASYEGWGEPGTDAIPYHYRAQCLAEMDVWEASLVLVPVLFMVPWRLEVYAVKRDEDAEADIELIRREGERFMNRLADNQPPPVDWTPATTRALRTMQPMLSDERVRIPKRLAERYRNARREKFRAEQKLGQAVNEILAATPGGRDIVTTEKGQVVQVATRRRFPRQTTDVKQLRELYPHIAKQLTRTTDVDALYAGKWTKDTM